MAEEPLKPDVSGSPQNPAISKPPSPNQQELPLGYILGVAGACAVLVVFFLVYGDLKSLPFVQGLAGLLMALATALLLFSLVPSTAWVRGAVGLGGAAAFYSLALPQIERFIFPNHAISGTIYYKGTTTPVKRVVVRVPSSAQETATNDRGDFTLPNVRSDVKTLVVNDGLKDFPFDVSSSGIYAVVETVDIAKTETFDTPFTVAEEPCTDKTAKKKCFVLNATIKKPGKQPSLLLRLQMPGSEAIAAADVIKPGDNYAAVTVPDLKRSREWDFNCAGKSEIEIQLKIELTFEGEWKNVDSKMVFKVSHWFEETTAK